MNYLIQAFACLPHKGGEYAVSWGWIIHLDKRVKDEDCIWVASITLTEKDIKDFGLKHVRLIPIRGMEKWNFLDFNPLYYRIWQRKAYKEAKKLKIDVCHVYSLSDFRQPGDWWKLNCNTIFGPVGGGQECPKVLLGYDSKSAKLRSTINFIQRFNPFFRYQIAKFSKVYSCNFETQAFLNRGDVLPDVPLNDKFLNLEINRHRKDTVTILSMGRLINKKGLLLLLDVLSLLDTETKWKCLIYGDGEQREIISERIRNLGLQERVHLMGAVQYDDISEVYRNADIFVLPSIRESGGSVLVEAAAHKLPLVALKMSLSVIFSRHNAGLFVNITQSKEVLLKEFTEAIRKLVEDEDLRRICGENAYSLVNVEFNWEKMIEEVYGEWISQNDER